MRRVSMVMCSGVVVLAAAGCSSGSSSGKAPAVTTTTPSSTLEPNATTTSTVRPTAAGGCAPEAQNDRPSPFGTSGPWIQMVSSHRGYAVIGRSVVGTTDGRHWTSLYRAPGELTYVDATDADHVWVVGAHSLYATTDGGATWSARESARPVIEKVHFVDADHGWATANGSLLQTIDGGHTWQAQRSPCPVDGVCFDNAQHGWVATHRAAYVTADGGAHWSLALDSHDGNATYGVALDIQCTSANSAWILFGGGNGAMGHEAYVGYRCPATGECNIVVRNNFMGPAVPGADGPGSSPGPFSVIDDHTAAFVGFTGPVDNPTSIMIVGDDGRERGQVWRVPAGPPPPPTPAGVSFTSRSEGWLVESDNDNAQIRHTTDGGKTWSVQYRAPSS